MRILFLAHYYPPEMGGAAARLHGLARWLVAFGHAVTVITGFPNYPSGVIPKSYRGKLHVRESLDGVELARTWVYASSHKSSLRRLANYLSFVLTALLTGLALNRHFDVVVASSPPLFIGLSGWLLAQLKGIPFVFDIRDLWPNVAVDAGEFAPDAAMIRWGYRLARFLYRRADHIVSVTENKRLKLLDAGVPAAKLSVVSNGVDLDLIPSALSDGCAVHGLQTKFVILYAGLIGIAQGLDVAVEAAQLLIEHHDIHFLIVGDGVQRDTLVDQVARHGLTNVTMLPRQPRERIPELMALADVCLVPLSNAGITDAVPSKLLEAWAFGKPVILAATGEAAVLVQQSGGGVVISPRDAAALAQAVLQLRSAPDRLARLGEAGQRYVAKHLARPALARKMETVLSEVISTHAAR